MCTLRTLNENAQGSLISLIGCDDRKAREGILPSALSMACGNRSGASAVHLSADRSDFMRHETV